MILSVSEIDDIARNAYSFKLALRYVQIFDYILWTCRKSN